MWTSTTKKKVSWYLAQLSAVGHQCRRLPTYALKNSRSNNLQIADPLLSAASELLANHNMWVSCTIPLAFSKTYEVDLAFCLLFNLPAHYCQPWQQYQVAQAQMICLCMS